VKVLPPPLAKKKGPVTKTDRPNITEATTQEVKQVSKKDPDFEIADIKNKISKLLKYSAFEPEHRYWLDTGYPDLNATLGSRKQGLPYGKIYELSGIEHGGKTALATIIAGMCQRDGAAVGYIDLEDSYDIDWATRLGLDCERVLPLAPKLIYAGKSKARKGQPDVVNATLGRMGVTKDLKLESAEMLFAEAEAAMALFSEKGYKKQFWILDSVANIQTEMSIDAGTTDRNMRVNLDRAMFLSNTLPRWAALAANYNAMIFLVNQIRDKVGLVFGSPEYTPGGRALRHACAIRAKVRRGEGGGRLKIDTRIVGIKGVIQNEKNKAGQGSVERCLVGFKIRWDKVPARIEFMPVADLKN
jgi:RecA/RadA recombinase